MILHYSLAIFNTNDNALSLLFFANAPMSGIGTRYIILRIGWRNECGAAALFEIYYVSRMY